jgi:hypothetical protein
MNDNAMRANLGTNNLLHMLTNFIVLLTEHPGWHALFQIKPTNALETANILNQVKKTILLNPD